MAHTPGPWYAKLYRSPVHVEDVWAVFTRGPTLSGFDGIFLGTVGSQPESEENAKLIAKAWLIPEILSVLKDTVIDECHWKGLYESEKLLRDIVEKLERE